MNIYLWVHAKWVLTCLPFDHQQAIESWITTLLDVERTTLHHEYSQMEGVYTLYF